MTRRRIFNSLWTSLIPCGLLLWVGPVLHAQQGAPRPSTKPRRAQAQQAPRQDARPQKLPPELERILRDWEEATSRIKTLQGKHQRIEYELTFKEETWTTGVFYYEAPDKGRIDFEAVNLTSESKPNVKGFKLKTDRPQRWICTGQHVLQIDDDRKTYEVFPIPPQMRGQRIMDGPLPFLFGMPAEKAKRRFEFQLEEETDEIIHLAIRPKLEQDSANYKWARILLDKRTYLPRAVKLMNPTETLITVYTFPPSDLKVNASLDGGILAKVFGGGNPFNPDLKAYKRVQNQIPGPGGGNPATRGSRTQQQNAGRNPSPSTRRR